MERLPLSPPTANAIELRAYFASFARELGARFAEDCQEDHVVLTPEIDQLLENLKGLSAQARKKPPRPRPC